MSDQEHGEALVDVVPDLYELSLPSGWRQIDRGIIRLTEILACGVGAAFAVLVCLEVVSRYFFNFSIFWIDSAAEMLLVWFFLLGAGLALRQRVHVSFRFFVDIMPRPLAAAVLAIAQLVVLGYCGLMAWSGYLMLAPAWRQIDPATEIKLLWVMLAFPVGFGLLVYHQATLSVIAARRWLTKRVVR